MPAPRFCSACGQPLLAGTPTCGSCGALVGPPSEEPLTAEVVGDDVGASGAPSDEPTVSMPVAGAGVAGVGTGGGAEEQPPAEEGSGGGTSRTRLWLIAGLAVLAVLLIGVVTALALTGDDDGEAARTAGDSTNGDDAGGDESGGDVANGDALPGEVPGGGALPGDAPGGGALPGDASEGGETTTTTATQMGTGTGQANAGPIAVAPTMLAFPDTAVGQTSAPIVVTLTNTSGVAQTPSLAGGAPLDQTFGGSQNCAGKTLPPGGSCEFSYFFRPTAAGPRSSTTSITIDGENVGLTFSGTGS